MSTFYQIAFYVCFIIFLIGLGYRVLSWFRWTIGPEAKNVSFAARVTATLKGLVSYLFSPRVLWLPKILIVDVILQIHILRQDILRWFMHICLYGGFMGLLLMHALEKQISVHLFSGYYSTVNPYIFLRDFFGVMVLTGIAIAIVRRRRVQGLKETTRPMDVTAIVVLAVIIGSGFLLHGVKITSHEVYQEMVSEYGSAEDALDISSLRAYWEKYYNVAFPGSLKPSATADLEWGAELHESDCSSCHARPQWAFVSYTVSEAVKPVGLVLAGVHMDPWKARADKWLWVIHILACFVGLAYLPFSKMLHIITSPLSLLLGQTTKKGMLNPARQVNLRAMYLDACTHCGNCSLHCSVRPVFKRLGNTDILPSEKLISLKKVVKSGQITVQDYFAFQEGSFICTSCSRCTRVCPAGINLQDLWLSSKQDLIEGGAPDIQSWARGKGAAKVKEIVRERDKPRVPTYESEGNGQGLTRQAQTFHACFTCMTCTNSCPVVASYDNPKEALDLLPHQIMHALALGFTDWALGARMIWDCATCYQCQEHCPQGVKVTEIMYELKNKAYNEWKGEALDEAASALEQPANDQETQEEAS